MHTTNNHDYHLSKNVTEHQVLDKAAEILANKYLREDVFTNAQATIDFLNFKLGKFDKEVFSVLLLDTQNQS